MPPHALSGAETGPETPENRLRRLRMRAWRRGTKEMDLILGTWSEAHLPALTPDRLAQFEAVLEENDQDLYAWITGTAASPPALAPLLQEIATHARQRLAPRR